MKQPSAYWLPIFFLMSGLAVLTADEVISPAPGGTSLFPQSVVSGFAKATPNEFGTSQIVKIDGMPFTEAVEMRAIKQPPNNYAFQLTQQVPGAIHKDDAIWITLWMRATETSNESQEGLSTLIVEQYAKPNDKMAVLGLTAGKNWRQFAWALRVGQGYGPGEARICFRGGYKPQVIQIGGIQMLNYGSSVKVTDLPQSKITYPGMEADVPWRKAATERIEKIRKGDIKIQVSDATGKPLSGATVRIQELRSAFGFGSCVVASKILEPGPDNDRYREIIKNDFSKVVMENDLKWATWDKGGPDRKKTTLDAMKWLRDQGIEIRGHNLVWPSWKFSPPDVSSLKNDKVALEKRIEDHISEEVGATKGLVTEWDVVNEPYANHDITDILGPESMVTWFKLVHQLDPQPVLYLNDFAGLTNLGKNTPHKDAFEQTLKALKAGGAPIGGLGIQAHFGDQFTGPEDLLKELDRWAALGLDIQITEFDLRTQNEAVQAQYTRDFMTAVFSHPSVTALLTWGFWEGSHWIPEAAMYRKDWSIKPNGQAWNDLVLKEWHTDLTADTNAAGEISTRGFLGDYQVTVTYHGTKKTWPVKLTHDGAELKAVVPSN